MDEQARTASLDQVIEEVVQRYGIEKETLRFLGGFLNRAYEYEKAGQQYILRISFESGRTVEMVQGEVDWLRYLGTHGLSVARPVASLRGNMVEVVESAKGPIPVVVFEKAAGHPAGPQEWNRELFWKMGQFTGRMHQLTKTYVPANPAYTRPSWSSEMDDFAGEYLWAVDEAIVEKFRAIRAYPEQLSQEKDAYGLVHIDFHRGNFFVQDGNITLFDFDDCQYSWFAGDIAMALFYAIFPQTETEKERAFAQTFYDTFLQGYRTTNALDARWLREVPYFLKQREIDLYVALSAVGIPNGGMVKQFMENRRQRILEDVPYVDIDF